jgi:1-deoxy-D-xylulose-5-phosphate reductoisomerase
MHLPIMNALAYPARLQASDTDFIRELNWSDVAQLNFEALDLSRFPCFRLALEAGQRGGTYPCALVGADEEAVDLFLHKKIGFLEIAELIDAVLEQHQSVEQPDVATALEACAWARRTVRELAHKRS